MPQPLPRICEPVSARQTHAPSACSKQIGAADVKAPRLRKFLHRPTIELSRTGTKATCAHELQPCWNSALNNHEWLRR